LFPIEEVSRVYKQINEKEDALSAPEKGKINLLVMSQSSSGLGGRSGKFLFSSIAA
jgi:hypothetical protein